MLPAPQRGHIVREIGDELRARKDDLGMLVTLEMGKILAEGRGEVQEMIDIADFAVGLSRQLYGLTMPASAPATACMSSGIPRSSWASSPRSIFPSPCGPGMRCIAAVCGDCVIWKPSPKTPSPPSLSTNLRARAPPRHGWEGVFNLVSARTIPIGAAPDQRSPRALDQRHRFHPHGPPCAETVGRRLGRTLLELGGNNGVIVMNDANLISLSRGPVWRCRHRRPALHLHPPPVPAARHCRRFTAMLHRRL